MVAITVPNFGRERPAARSPLYKARAASLSRPITSPVDFISGPRVTSTLRSLAKEKTGTFTATSPFSGHSPPRYPWEGRLSRSEEHTSELQSRENLVCRLLLEKKKR